MQLEGPILLRCVGSFEPLTAVLPADCHLLDHGNDQLAVTVIQVRRVAADLREEANLIFSELRTGFGGAVLGGVREELRERNVHGAGDLRQRVERGNGVTVLHAREIAAQQASTFFNVALRHALLQAVVSDCFADIH